MEKKQTIELLKGTHETKAAVERFRAVLLFDGLHAILAHRDGRRSTRAVLRVRSIRARTRHDVARLARWPQLALLLLNCERNKRSIRDAL